VKKIVSLIVFGMTAALFAGCGTTQQPQPYLSGVTPGLNVSDPDGIAADAHFRLAVDATLTNQSDNERLTCNVADFTLIMNNGGTSVPPDAGSSCDQTALAPHTTTKVHLFFGSYNAQKADYSLFWEDGVASYGNTFGAPSEKVPFAFDSGKDGHGT
jgi:hypothetical protein